MRVFLGVLPGLILAVLSSLPAHAASPKITEALARIDGFKVAPLKSIVEVTSRSQLGPFDADLLKEYSIVSYTLWRVKPDGEAAEFRVEVYASTDSTGAFGLFSIWPGQKAGSAPQRLQIPLENRFQSGELVFWRGPYVFRLSRHLKPASVEVFRNFALQVKKQLKGPSPEPINVYLLPKQNLIPNSVHLYLGQAALSNDSEVPEWLKSRVGFKDHSKVAIAQYRPHRSSLVILTYPTTPIASEYAAKLEQALGSVFSPTGIFLKRTGAIVSIFLGPQAEAESVLSRINYNPTIRWLYNTVPVPRGLSPASGAPNFLGVVANSLILTGLFVVLTLAVGVLAGMLRYQVLERFKVLGERRKTIRLDL